MTAREENWKWCNNCKMHKPRSKFWKDATKSDGLTTQCSACAGGSAARWRRFNDEKYLASARRSARNYKKKQKYGITVEEYDELLVQHRGLCGACGQLPTRILQIDYSRELDRVRGFVCESCHRRLAHDQLTYAQAKEVLVTLPDPRLVAHKVAQYVIRHHEGGMEAEAGREELTDP